MTVRKVEVREQVMARHDKLAAPVRARLAAHGVTALSLMSSPGAGTTTLRDRTMAELTGLLEIAVVAGDCRTQNDAGRLAARAGRLGQALVTGGVRHSDAPQVHDTLGHIDVDRTRLVILENVGHAVCPASRDRGGMARVVPFTVTEGEDHPLTYPKLFETAGRVLLTKSDLLRRSVRPLAASA